MSLESPGPSHPQNLPFRLKPFYLCDLEPTGVDQLQKPAPDCLEPERAAWQSRVTSPPPAGSWDYSQIW